MKTKAFTGTWDVGACCRATLARWWGGCGALSGEAWLLTVKESSLTRDGEHGGACACPGPRDLEAHLQASYRCHCALRHCAPG